MYSSNTTSYRTYWGGTTTIVCIMETLGSNFVGVVSVGRAQARKTEDLEALCSIHSQGSVLLLFDTK